ncbi:MAG: helicase-related protein [Pseudomonadota bacterium]
MTAFPAATTASRPLPSRSNPNRAVTAVLGPTNTGKTHLAIERMLGHETGMIGLPLRLLAREVFAKVTNRVGSDAVALVTGEEKIVPPEPRYWVCTVEAMPLDTDVAFVAIDEVQLAGDLERGHVFTDRLLNLRGSQETLLLGAATMRGILERILPGLNVITRPRMSVLAYAGQKKITRLPSRSAIVAFSADEVYAIAELVRRQRGGAAVVMGALSPRTRNAQVDLYQSGDVDFLIATDAIGMGLNLDVDHIAFASDRKFDGYQYRNLTPAELGQISGRAGRHTKDGTFGVTARVDPFPDPLVEALESHAFAPVSVLQWRARDLVMDTIQRLRESLDRVPDEPGLTRAPPAADLVALDHAIKDDDVRERATHPDRVSLLWNVCQLPDYRRIAPANHYDLVRTIFMQIVEDGVVDPDWLESSIRQCSSTEGDIDTLANRIAHIRTWTFVANRPDWLARPDTWRDMTQDIENALSDALHERLTQRFVDRRTSVLMRRLRENTMLEADITAGGDVVVEGEHVGHLDGFRFTPASKGDSTEAKAVRAAAMKALAAEIGRRADRIANADNGAFVLAAGDTIRWQGEAVAKLVGTEDLLRPRVLLLADEHLTGPSLEKVQARLDAWAASHVSGLLKPLFDLKDADDLTGIARGVAYRLLENLGNVTRTEISEDVRKLDQETRALMRRYGVRFGAYTIYVPALLKPAPSQLLAELWALGQPDTDIPGLQEIPQLSASGRTSVPVEPTFSSELYRVAGYRVCGNRAVRIDILERLADLIRPLIAWRPTETEKEPPEGAIERGGGFTVTVAMTSLLGCAGSDFAEVLKALGYRVQRVPRPEAEPSVTTDAEGLAETPDTDAVNKPVETVAEVPSPTVAEVHAETGTSTTTGDTGTAAAAQEVDAPARAEGSEADVDATGPYDQSTEAADETAFIEIWRPGGGERRRRPQGRNAPQGRRERNGGTGDQSMSADADGATEGRDRSGGRKRRPQERERGDRDGPRHKGASSKPRQPDRKNGQKRPDKPMDPDSPFAALAALKASLEKEQK